MARVFISFANEDRDYAGRLARLLIEAGQQPLMDEMVLVPGEKWQPKLHETLKSADVVVFLISAASLSKTNTNTEFARAVGYAESTERLLVLPVLLEKVQVPAIMSQYQYINGVDRQAEEVLPIILQSVAGFEASKAEREIRIEKVESDLSLYVDEAIAQQRASEMANRSSGKNWNLLGVVFLLAGLGQTAFLAYHVISVGPSLTISAAASIVVLNIVSIGILAALAKYAYSLGKSFITEALKSADRIHAMQFGKFYLKAYGGRLTPGEVKEAFQHWNIDRNSTFASLDASQIDPQVISLISQVVSATLGKKDK